MKPEILQEMRRIVEDGPPEVLDQVRSALSLMASQVKSPVSVQMQFSSQPLALGWSMKATFTCTRKSPAWPSQQGTVLAPTLWYELVVTTKGEKAGRWFVQGTILFTKATKILSSVAVKDVDAAIKLVRESFLAHCYDTIDYD